MASKEEVVRLSTLARISIEESRMDALVRDFEEIIQYISHIQDVEINALQSGVPEKTVNVFREDMGANTPGEYTEAILAGAPRKKGRSIAVRKVISHE
jgi:aspartyl/glutamyl-tRNA(Asn/Gln) amidotransferase C subunit